MSDMIYARKHAGVLFASLTAIVVAAALTACGGGGEETANASPLSKPQFIKQANAICQEGLEKKELRIQEAAEARPANFQASARVLELVAVGALLPVYAEAFSRLGELKPPMSDEEKIRKMVSQYEHAIERAKADPSLVLKGDPFIKGNQVAQSYGMEACRF